MKRETIGLLWGVLLMLAANAGADTHIPGGFVSGTWTLAGSPYILDGNVVVHQDSTLTIEPGVNVMMDPGRRFRCEGQLWAVGTQQDSIHIIATDTFTGSEGLDFLNTNSSPRDSSKLVYCDISYGVASPAPDLYRHGGGIYINNSSRLLVSHCLISHCRTRNVTGANGPNGAGGSSVGQPGGAGETVQAGCGGAIYCENSNPAITFNTMANNHTGEAHGGNGGNGGNAGDFYAFSAQGGAGGVGGNGSGGDGGGIYLHNSQAFLDGNSFKNNGTGQGYGGVGGNGGYGIAGEGAGYGGDGGAGGVGNGGKGGAIYGFASSARINNNIVFQNTSGNGSGGDGGNGGDGWGGYGGSDGSGGDGGNGYGGEGYAVFSSTNSLDSLMSGTITAHQTTNFGQGGSGGSGGGPGNPGTGLAGVQVISGETLVVRNSIVWNNAAANISPGATITYSCIQGGFPGAGNINLDPLLVNPALDEFCLAQMAAGQNQESPCVNAAAPTAQMLAGTTRTDGVQDSGVLDMGYHYPPLTQQPQVLLTLTPHNPPIQLPSGGGSFQFDVQITANQFYSGVIDFWTVILLPGGQPYPILMRQNINLPAGSSIIRPNLTQYIPAGAPAGAYAYNAYIRDHNTWEDLAEDSFPFEKLSGQDNPSHDFGWVLLGWPDDPIEESPAALPHETTLLSAQPNPFNAALQLQFLLRTTSQVNLSIFDVQGREIAQLLDGSLAAGEHQLTWDARGFPSGIYFARISTVHALETTRLLLLK